MRGHYPNGLGSQKRVVLDQDGHVQFSWNAAQTLNRTHRQSSSERLLAVQTRPALIALVTIICNTCALRAVRINFSALSSGRHCSEIVPWLGPLTACAGTCVISIALSDFMLTRTFKVEDVAMRVSKARTIAALARNVLRRWSRWSVDVSPEHHLVQLAHHLRLRNKPTLFWVDSAATVPGFSEFEGEEAPRGK